MLTKIEIDALIRKEFAVLERTVDDLLCRPDEARAFASQVVANVEGEATEYGVLKRLIGLRKLGEDKGGLPRTQRNFGGRNRKPR